MTVFMFGWREYRQVYSFVVCKRVYWNCSQIPQ